MAEITSLRQGGWRYLVPNGLTALNLAFGAIACFLAIGGSYYSAGWFILLAVCFDRLDGASARALGATSQFGVEFDSLADLVSFGIAPAVLVYAVLSGDPALGYSSGWRQWLLIASCVFYVISCAFRLARFNVFAGADGTKIYFGLPSPASASTVVAALMTMIKYSGGGGGWVADAEILGGLTLSSDLRAWFPLLVAAVGVLMISTLRVPKMNPDKSIKGLYLAANMLLIYVCVLLRIFPEYLAFMAVQVIVVSFSFHFFWDSAKKLNAGTVWQALSIEADPTNGADSAPETSASK